MNMKKPEIKVMRFVNEDVIATSGATPPDFVLSGFCDGVENNLTTIVNGTPINGRSALSAAFKEKWGGDNYTSISLTYSFNDGNAQPVVYSLSGFEKGSGGFDGSYHVDRVNANGIYKYSSHEGQRIFFTQITQ